MSKRIELKHPITVDGKTYTELTMRRCKVRDRRLAEKQHNNDADREVALITNLCEVTPDVIDELDASDYDQCQKVLMGFLSSATPS